MSDHALIEQWREKEDLRAEVRELREALTTARGLLREIVDEAMPADDWWIRVRAWLRASEQRNNDG